VKRRSNHWSWDESAALVKAIVLTLVLIALLLWRAA